MVDPGSCEVEAFVSRVTARDTPRETGWWLQPGCGIGLRTQLALGGGRTRAVGSSIPSLALLGKTFLRELKDDRFGVTVAYQLVGQETSTRSLEHDLTDVKAVLTAPLGGPLLHTNLGWTRSRLEQLDSTTWALAVEVPVTPRFDLGVESHGDDRTAAWLGFGARYAVVADRFFVDLSYALQTSSARARLLTVGVKVALG